jgi:gliding motility-associated-like protein
MEGKQNDIEQLFKEAFANHEMEVGSHVWAGVQSALSAKAAVTSAAGASAFAQAAAVVGVASIIALGAVNETVLFQQNHLPAAEITIKENPEVESLNAVFESESKESTSDNSNDSEINSIVASSEDKPQKVDLIEPLVEPKVRNDANLKSDLDEDAKNTIARNDANKEPIKSSNAIKAETPRGPTKIAQPAEEPGLASESESSETPKKDCQIHFSHQAKTYISPDGDGTNDCFHVEGGASVVDFHVRIWTRGGELLHESNDINTQWCGTDRSGKIIPNRTMCYYEIIAVDSEGLLYSQKNARGSIMVITSR